MKFEQLLIQLNSHKISLKLVDGKVKVFDPQKNLNDDLVHWLKHFKTQLVDWLSEGAGYTESDFAYARLTSNQISQIESQYVQLEKLYIATPMQTGFLFHGLLDGSGASYTTQTFCQLIGDVNIDLLRQAWQLIVDRHDILRTCFVGLDTEQVHQLVQKKVKLPFDVEDWRQVPKAVQHQRLTHWRDQDKAKGFDFATAPLMRISLLQLSDEEYHFVWTHHHALLDGWCAAIVFSEILNCYQALSSNTKPNLPAVIGYEQYIGWLFNQDNNKAKAFWKQQLSGFDAPTQMLTPSVAKGAVAPGVRTVRLSIDDAITAELENMGKTVLCTMNAIVQAAWSYLLHRYSTDDSVVFGSTISGRPAHLPGVEQMMGLFINTIPVRVDYKDGLTLGQLLKTLTTSGAQRDEFGYVSLADIQRVSEVPSGSSLFDTLLVFENYPTGEAIGAQANTHQQAFSVEAVNSASHTNFPLAVIAHCQNGHLQCNLNYQGDMFSEQVINRLASHLEHVLTSMAKGGAALRVNDLELVTETERQQLVHQFNDVTAEYPKDVTVHQLIEQQVSLSPDNIAVKFNDQTLTYEQLDQQANQLAHYLIVQGVKPDTLVGLCVERSLAMMVALIGILKAGGAYVPLDSDYPKARLAHMIEDANVKLIVGQQELIASLPEGEYQTIYLDEPQQQQQLQQMPLHKPNSEAMGLTPNHLAYVIYTSGSTGLPKGVLINHSSVVNFLCFGKTRFLDEHISGSVVSSPIAFDATVQSLYVPLLAGKYVELLPADALPQETLTQRLFGDGDNLLFKITPAHLKALSAEGITQTNPLARHVVVVAGELLTTDTILPWTSRYLPSTTFINEYGPTEATVGSSTYIIDSNHLVNENNSGIPIGEPLANVSLYVLDKYQRLQPIGGEGELYIGGAGLARGYLNQAQMTADKFIANPFSNNSNDRLYRTGDLVRWLDDGNIDYISRIDNQVKLRGFRIELGEIESIVAAIDSVEDVAVLVRQDPGHENRLVCYVVDGDGIEDEETFLRDARQSILIEQYKQVLSDKVPDYMVPAYYVFLDALPLTPNGKLDRHALPAPQSSDVQKETYVAPRNTIERQLCEIFQEVLKIEQVGIEDNFFSLGGDSIISIQVVSRAKMLELHFGVRQLLDFPTIASLSPLVNQQAASVAPQVEISGNLPLLPIQQRFFDHPLADPNHYNQSVLLDTPSSFNLLALEHLVTAIYQRHDALRVQFDLTSGQATHLPFEPQMVTQAVSYHDLSDVEAQLWDEQTTQLCTDIQTSLDIEKAVLFKAMYLDFGPQHAGRLLLVSHHLVVDAVSWRIIMTDLTTGWQQLQKSQSIELAPKTSALQQWGAAIHEYAYSTVIESERNYWLAQLAIDVTPIPQPAEPEPVDHTRRQFAKFNLGQENTKLLLGECNEAYRTRINELLLASLLKAYQGWAGGDALTLNMESHGREDLFEQLDTSETVGWFTAIYPLVLVVDHQSDISTLIRTVKDQYRQLPNNGIGYGILQDIRKDNQLLELASKQQRPSIKFNYLGQIDSIAGEQGDFSLTDNDGALSGPKSGSENAFLTDMLISAEVYAGEMRFNVSLGNQYQSAQAFADLLKQAIIDIINRCDSLNKKDALVQSSKAIVSDDSMLRKKGIQI